MQEHWSGLPFLLQYIFYHNFLKNKQKGGADRAKKESPSGPGQRRGTMYPSSSAAKPGAGWPPHMCHFL